MNQKQYEIILACIRFGCPAIADELMTAFNQVMQNSNEFVTAQLRAEEEARKAKEAAHKKALEEEAHKKALEQANKKIAK